LLHALFMYHPVEIEHDFIIKLELR
jgi:hypothetical protein